MKNNKKTIVTLCVLATISFATAIKAQEVTLPVITKPSILQEGTQRELTQQQIAELLPWAKDSKAFLKTLLEDIDGLATTDKIERLVDGIKSTVGDSAPKHSELLMRYALNRGLVLQEILSKEIDSETVGSSDAKLRILISSINMALKYYEIDMSVMQKNTKSPFVLFGLDYFEFLNELNKSVFDASAQYQIQRTALEWLQWDLYRDVENTAYAPQINRIYNSLKTFSNKKMTDAQSIANIRLLKKIAQQLNVKETLAKLENERKMHLIATDSTAKAAYEREIAQAKAQREQAAYDLLRASRSAIDIEKVKNISPALYSSSWIKRKEAAEQLSNVIGGDVTLILFQRVMVETEGVVSEVLIRALENRLNSKSYILKSDDLEKVNLSLTNSLVREEKSRNWIIRLNIAKLLGKIPTVESYKFLSTWLGNESESVVSSAIKSSMSVLEATIRR